MIREDAAARTIDVETLRALNLRPLWLEAVSAVTRQEPGQPLRRTVPALWNYRTLREQLLIAGECVGVEQAERRVLVLVNPGHRSPEALSANSSIFVGAQLVLPGETTMCHRHSAGAARFLVEGSQISTIVNGVQLQMEPGDLILTPPHHWHEHMHDGNGPAIWLDLLDIPVSNAIEAIYFERGQVTPAADLKQPSAAYRTPGVVPYRGPTTAPLPYALLRYAWSEVRETLIALGASAQRTEQVHLMYINPETGSSALEPYCFSVRMLRPGEEVTVKLTSASAIFHVIDGIGKSLIGDLDARWEAGDVLAAPSQTPVRHRNRSTTKPAFLLQVDNSPLQHKLGWYRELA